MKSKVQSILVTILLLSGSLPARNNIPNNSSHNKPVAIIELFTSQGCSSCPSADLLLSQTLKNAKKEGKNIIALSFHVDYWNRLGWIDPFSDKAYSSRQNKYAASMRLNSVYTPQMIVNGQEEFVGSNKLKLNQAIEKSLSITPKAFFKKLSAIEQTDKTIKIQYELDGFYSQSDINFAAVSLTETTKIIRGENEGRTLINENVVQQFKSISANASGFISFENTNNWKGKKVAIVAYIQQKDLKIIGASITDLVQ